MAPAIDLPPAPLRGRYMAAAARMEENGTPIDVEALEELRENWKGIQGRLIERINVDYAVYIPRGRKRIDPETSFGAAILAEALDHELDPYRLAEATDHVWKAELDARLEWERAKANARRDSGLTVAKINDWERHGDKRGRGGDHSDYPSLDLTAREIAGRYPKLGLGPGYIGDDGQQWEAAQPAAEKIERHVALRQLPRRRSGLPHGSYIMGLKDFQLCVSLSSGRCLIHVIVLLEILATVSLSLEGVASLRRLDLHQLGVDCCRTSSIEN